MIFNNLELLKTDKTNFLVTKDDKISYQRAIERINRVSKIVTDNGVKPGNTVLLSVTNDYDTACIFLSLLNLGVTTVLLDPRYKSKKATTILKTLAIDGWIVDKNLETDWGLPENTKISLAIDPPQKRKSTLNKLLKKKSEVTDSTVTLDSLLEQQPGLEQYPAIDPAQVAYILFTSGSSSTPKGVKISYANLQAHLKTLSEQYELATTSRILNILPIYHTDGIIQGPVLAFFVGATLLRPFDFEIGNIPSLFDGIYKYRVTHFLTVPSMLSMLFKLSTGYEDSFKTEDFRYIISSASILEKSLWEDFEGKFNVSITNVYGLTETVAGGLFSGPNPTTKRVGSIGKPIDCEARIINNEGIEIKDSNEVGELILKGEHITNSYTNNNEVLKEGWFHTGDLVYMDCDGFFYIHGRKSNLIISGGVNISPEEIQEVINSFEGVAESYVYGVKDETWGEKIEAAIVPSKSTLEEDALRAYCSEYLETNKIPSHFYTIKEIPKTLSGKLDKEGLFKLLENSNGNNDEADLRKKIISMASSAFNIASDFVDVYAHSKSVDGWTSLNHLDFIVKIEKAFGVKFSTPEIMNVNTIDDAIKITKGKIG